MEPNKVRCPQCGPGNRVPRSAQGVPRCGNRHRRGQYETDSPTLERAAGERAATLKLVEAGGSEAPVTSQRYTVRAIPTRLLGSQEQVSVRQLVAASVAALRNWFDISLAEDTLEEAR